MNGKFSFTGSGELRVRSGGRALVASGDAISIGNRVFRLAEVDRVAYHAAARINQASYSIGLAAGDAKSRFAFDAFRRGTEFDDARETWRRLVELLETTACPRIAHTAVRAISAGETVKFGGSLSPRLDADAEGLRRYELFAKKVPWPEITEVDMREGQVRVWTSGCVKPAIAVGMFGWNAVVLPRVAAVIGRG